MPYYAREDFLAARNPREAFAVDEVRAVVSFDVEQAAVAVAHGRDGLGARPQVGCEFWQAGGVGNVVHGRVPAIIRMAVW